MNWPCSAKCSWIVLTKHCSCHQCLLMWSKLHDSWSFWESNTNLKVLCLFWLPHLFGMSLGFHWFNWSVNVLQSAIKRLNSGTGTGLNNLQCSVIHVSWCVQNKQKIPQHKLCVSRNGSWLLQCIQLSWLCLGLPAPLCYAPSQARGRARVAPRHRVSFPKWEKCSHYIGDKLFLIPGHAFLVCLCYMKI